MNYFLPLHLLNDRDHLSYSSSPLHGDKIWLLRVSRGFSAGEVKWFIIDAPVDSLEDLSASERWIRQSL
jgi:hypothetical protein